MPPRRSTDLRRRRVLLGLGGVALLVVLLLALMAWQGWTAFRASQEASEDLGDFREQLLGRDIEGARESLSQAQEQSARARGAVDGPLWGLVTGLPGIGDDVDVVRRLTVVVDDVTQGALPAAMTALSEVDPREIGLDDGGVPLAPLREASDQLSRSAELLRQADEEAAEIDPDGVSATLRARVTDVQDQLSRTSGLASRAAVAAELLPGMLGGDDPRTYLLIAQNNAEQRSLGGIVGALAVLRAEDGQLRLVRQATASDVGVFEEPVLPLSDAEVALYGTALGRFPQNPPDTPDFPRAAELIKAMWEERQGGTIDGVVSIDPWALQLVLGAVGPVDTDAGRLTGNNAVQRLLVDVYAEFPDGDQQNDVFAAAARAVFQRVQTFEGDPRALTSALAEGVDQGRVLLWSTREEEQEVLAGTALGGTLEDPTPETPRVGVHLHDGTGSKMNTYQQVGVQLRPDSCGSATEATVQVQLRSTAPADRDLPPSVTGDGSRVTPGDILTQVVVYAPQGWSFTAIDSSDGRDDLITYRHDGLWAGTREFRLPPGAERTLTLTMTGQSLSAPFEIRYTPGPRPATVSADSGCP